MGVTSKVIRKFCWHNKDNGKGMSWLKWKRVCTPKAMGGVGFRGLHLFNLALIAKQGWRLLNNPNTLCYKVMKARYFPHCSFLEANLGSKPSYLWRSMWTAKKVFTKGGVWRVGNGEKINILGDSWLPSINNTRVQGNNTMFLRDSKVEDLIDTSTMKWKEELIRRVFPDFEAELILSIPMCRASTPDKFVWNHTNSGEYSVKSGYYYMLDMELENGPHKMIWKKLWSSSVTRKVKLCIWKLCNGILPAATVLNKRIKDVNQHCSKCITAREDELRAVKNCPIANSALNLCNFPPSVTEGDFLDATLWLEAVAVNLSAEDFDRLLTTIWIIWTARNAMVHSGAMDSDIRLAEKVKMYFEEYKKVMESETNVIPRVDKVSWKPLTSGFQKLNFDASFNETNKTGGVGVVIRDVDGFVLAAASIKIERVQDSTMAEAMAVTEALRFTVDLGYLNLMIEGDSLTVIKELRTKEANFSRIGPWIEESKELLRDHHYNQILFTRQEGNQVADALAKLSKSLECNRYWIEEYHPSIHTLVINDVARA